MKLIFRIAAIAGCIGISTISFSQNWNTSGNVLAATGVIGSTNSFDVKLITKGTSRMIIKKNGYIGVGTNNPLVAFHTFGAMQIENNNTIKYDDPLLVLRSAAANGTATNPVIAFKVEDTTFAIMGYDVSTKDMVFSTQSAGLTPDLIINHVNGFTGLNTKTPQERLHVVGNELIEGNLIFNTGTQSIQFANPGASPEAMMYMFKSGTTNADRMVISHSPGYPTWGLQYSDNGDAFKFLAAGTVRLNINLSSGSTTFGGAAIPDGDNTRLLGSSSARWSAVWSANGTIQTSDAKDKMNIRDLNYGINEIMKLKPVRFDWKAKPDEGDKLGLIAQDLQKVLPEVVRNWDYVTDEKGKESKVSIDKLGVMYADIIPVLIRGMQEQQKEIEDLKSQLGNANSSQNSTASTTVVLDNTSLQQNMPNPVKSFTTINYKLAKTGSLKITDDSGNIIKTISLNANAKGSVNVDCSSLSAGTYFYSLIINGKIIDTKKMMVTK